MVLGVLFTLPSYAKDYPSFGPITLREQNPIYLQTLGLEPARALVLPKGTIEGRVDWAYSNIYETGQSATNKLTLDMELMRLAFHFLYGATDDLEIGLELPFYHSGGGFLDAFIQDFHKFFHLPNGGRDQVANNQYTYQFYSGGMLAYDVPSQAFTPGDVTFRIKHNPLKEGRIHPALSWFADFKLPTGSKSNGTGNGVFDFGLGLAIEKSYRRVHGYLNAEYILTGADTAYQPYMRSNMFAYAAALEVTLLDSWSVIAQLNGSTSLLANTGMDSWDGIPMNLVIGFRGLEKELIGKTDLIWQVGFAEDILSTGPSVDFTAFTSLGFRFNLLN